MAISRPVSLPAGQVGLVGYWYDQLSCDGGVGDRVGCFELHVASVSADCLNHPAPQRLSGLSQYQGLQGIRL
jgi:hypothetical protein